MNAPAPVPAEFARAYVRVSSKAQDHATQRDAIERLAHAHAQPIGTWHAEKMSGKTLQRPELEALRGAIRARTVRVLYVYRLDRLTRSGIRDTLEVVDEARANGCRIVSVSDGFALDGPHADVILAVMAWAAQMERAAINERISAARVRVEGEGGAWGRPKRWTPEQAAQAAQLRREGRSVRAIAVALKIPKATVGRMLAAAEPVPNGKRHLPGGR